MAWRALEVADAELAYPLIGCPVVSIPLRHTLSPDMTQAGNQCRDCPLGALCPRPHAMTCKHCLEAPFFDSDIALEGAVSGILISIEPDMFVRGFAEWKHRLPQCIDQRGDYL
jgi:hypothetical protein